MEQEGGHMQEPKQQAQHGVEGDAPHRAEAFIAIRRNEERKQCITNLQTSRQRD